MFPADYFRLVDEAAGVDGLREHFGVRGCLDWSERELHVAGALGAALANRFFELGWIRRPRAIARSKSSTNREC
jgi:hypothetical protein